MLRQVRDSTFMNDKGQANRAARELLKFILNNKPAFSKIRNGEKQYSDALDMSQSNENFTPGQLNYIDGIYENMMKALGFESVTRHIDRKRRGAGL